MEPKKQAVEVYGNLNRETSIPAYERIIITREVVFTCVRCSQKQREWRYPGPTPKYCPPCRARVAEEREERRVQRQREKRKVDRLARDRNR